MDLGNTRWCQTQCNLQSKSQGSERKLSVRRIDRLGEVPLVPALRNISKRDPVDFSGAASPLRSKRKLCPSAGLGRLRQSRKRQGPSEVSTRIIVAVERPLETSFVIEKVVGIEASLPQEVVGTAPISLPPPLDTILKSRRHYCQTLPRSYCAGLSLRRPHPGEAMLNLLEPLARWR